MSVYEVRLTHTGFTSFSVSPAECKIRGNGTVVLYGLLYGLEKVGDNDDINYYGTLQLDMDMDICSADRNGGGEDNLCKMTAVGSGPVKTKLDIYFDGRGGYVNIDDSGGPFMRSLTGNCGQLQMDEEKPMIPFKTIATIFNGRDLPMLTNRTLRVGRYVEDDHEGNVTVVDVLRQLRIR